MNRESDTHRQAETPKRRLRSWVARCLQGIRTAYRYITLHLDLQYSLIKRKLKRTWVYGPASKRGWANAALRRHRERVGA